MGNTGWSARLAESSWPTPNTFVTEGKKRMKTSKIWVQFYAVDECGKATWQSMKLIDVGDVSKNPNYTESMLQNSARFP